MITPLLLAALAGASTPPPEFLGADTEAAWRQFLTTRALKAESDSTRDPPCATATITEVAGDQIPEWAIPAPAVEAREGPAVRVRVKVEGCGRSSVQNLYVQHQKAGGWASHAATPGWTLAEPKLQADLTGELSDFILKAPSNGLTCDKAAFTRSLTVLHTEVTQSPAKDGGPWKERWFAGACATIFPVDVDLTPADGGVRYNLTPAKG